MNGAADPAGVQGPLSVEGNVRLGVELSGAEREASLRRGGDARVARFEGGYLRANFPAGRPAAIGGKAMTLYVRVQDPTGRWAAPLLAKDDPRDTYGPILYGADDSLHYLWRTEPLQQRTLGMAGSTGSGARGQEIADGVLRLRVPVAIIDPVGWHDVVARFRGPNLELFVDGVLVDEEWPHGALYQFCAPFLIGAGYERGQVKAGFHGAIDCVALWSRALANEEIARLAGGAAEVARRDLAMFGPVPTSVQYWKPRGYNAWAGDCMPFFHDGTFHLFYFILGTNAIWKSRGALGPWEEMKPTIYDGLFVPKVAEFTGNRRILAGFLFERGWAGHLALRELIQSADGALGTKWPPEVIPAGGDPIQLAWAAARHEVSGDGRSIKIRGAEKFAAGMLRHVPRNARITLRVTAGPGAKRFGLCLRAKGDYESGCELRFEPARQRAQYGVPQHHGPAKDSIGRVANGRDYAIQDVDGLRRPFRLEIIVKGDIIDTCIDQRRTMITRRDPEPEGDGLFLFAEGGDVTFAEIAIRPL